jgi:hypothetical protein
MPPRAWKVLPLIVFCAACTVTQPVAVISKSGQVLRGTVTAGLTSGSFTASDGRLTCGGGYDSLETSVTINVKITCNDGRTGFGIITRDAGGISGSGRIRLTDGTEADVIFGPAAQGF